MKMVFQNRFLSWVEIDQMAIRHNIKILRKLIGKKNILSRTGRKIILAPSVKANAYGHGMEAVSKIILSLGADWLCVNSLWEAKILRQTGIKAPIYIMGYVLKKELASVLTENCRIVVYNRETVEELSKIAHKLGKKARIHIKVETGNNRQGVVLDETTNFIVWAKKFPHIAIEGIATHFANIEDMQRKELFSLNNYAQFQLHNFQKILSELECRNIKIPIRHCANSAATLLFPQTHFDMVRPGIAVYGLWPSYETKMAVQKKHPGFKLYPVLTWKTRIAQIKEIPKGAFIGYGCTYRTKQKTRIAILPVGYYDGYDRGFSNKSNVLIHEKRAPLCGRVCMNIITVDVTKIPEAHVEDEVILLGENGNEEITADELAKLIDTINYEITTRINERIPRIITN